MIQKKTAIRIYFWISRCIMLAIFVITIITLLGVKKAPAEPTVECRNLARLFADNPKELDDNSLAKLRTCITTEIMKRLDIRLLPPPAYTFPVKPAPTEKAPK